MVLSYGVQRAICGTVLVLIGYWERQGAYVRLRSDPVSSELEEAKWLS